MPSTFTCMLIHVIFGTLGRVQSIQPEWQAEHHRWRTFREEYEDLLRKHNIPFDPRYVQGD
ncbi:MAG: hypothetical protein JXQ27_06100 [Acidobacteria bacterium]|nr:hypothetical protein [Acidobacteriota bacterium]